MADRMTPTQAGRDKPVGEEPEAKAASAVLDDLESLRKRGSAAEQQRDERSEERRVGKECSS